MKRSDAIKILSKAINEHMDVKYDYAVSTEAIKAGLLALEAIGMLPPDNGKEAYDILDYRSKCLKWEPEDG